MRNYLERCEEVSCVLEQLRRFSENDRSVGLAARPGHWRGLRRRASGTLLSRRLSGSSARLRGLSARLRGRRRLLDSKLEKARIFKWFGGSRLPPYRRDGAGAEAVFLDAGVRCKSARGNRWSALGPQFTSLSAHGFRSFSANSSSTAIPIGTRMRSCASKLA